MSVQAQTLTEAPAAQRGGVGEVAKLAFPRRAGDHRGDGHAGDRHRDGRPARRHPARRGRLRGPRGSGHCFVLFTGTAQGVQAFVSRHDGANEQQQCGPWIWQAVWLVVPGMTALDVRARLPVPADRGLRRSVARAAEGGDRVRLGAAARRARGRDELRAVRVLPRHRRHAHAARRHADRSRRASRVRLRADLRRARHAGVGRSRRGRGAVDHELHVPGAACSTRCSAGRCARATTRGRSGRGSRRWGASCAPARRSAASGSST